MRIAALTLAATLVASCTAKEPSPEKAVKISLAPAPETTPSLGDVIALEIEQGRQPRRIVRDPAALEKVVELLAPAPDWEKSGVPRSRPALWARLVPPSAEGGASFLFAEANGPAYLSLPGADTYRLPEAASRTLYALVTALESSELGSLAPTRVTENLSSLVLTATLAGGAEKSGLRSITLYPPGHRLEPDATWEDGSPVSQSFELSPDDARQLSGALALSGFFHRAKKFHSPSSEPSPSPPPSPPPEGSSERPPPPPSAGSGSVQVTVTAGPWHHTWAEGNAQAIFAHTLSAIKRSEPGTDVVTAIDALLAQLP